MKPIIYIVFLAVLTFPVHARSWTSADGKVIEADFIKLDDKTVVIEMKGKEFRVPLTKFSQEDQDFVKEESARLAEVSAVEAKKFLGQEITFGKLLEFEHELSAENKGLAKKGGKGWGDSFSSAFSLPWLGELAEGHEVNQVRFLLGFPENFDPEKGCPIFVQWTSTDSKSHIKGGKSYWNDCKEKGWILVSVEGAPNAKATWSNPVFYAGIKEFFEQLHQKFKGSEKWPVATGGFSGGAKICQWMGGVMHELDGVEVKGYWLGGCNEALFSYGIEDLSISKRSFRGAKAYISSGDSDKLVKDTHRTRVSDGAEAAGLEVKSKVYSGGHRKNSEQFKEALDWFIE